MWTVSRSRRAGQQERAGAEGALGVAWCEAAFGQQCGLLVDDQAGDGNRRPENVGVADDLVAADDLRKHPRRSARTGRSARRPTPTESSEVSSDLLAVETSVTNAPHNRCTSQVSVVVTTPSVVMFARIHAIFGAEKYGSSTRPVRCATMSADRRQRCADRLGAAVLPHHGRCQRATGAPVPRQDGLALVGQCDGGDRNVGLRQGFPACVDDRVEQRLRILLDPAACQILRPHRDLGDRRRPGLPRRPRSPSFPKSPGRSPGSGACAEPAVSASPSPILRRARHRSMPYPALSARSCREWPAGSRDSKRRSTTSR